MPELILFRHAKSRWDEPGVDDHDRDLSPRGERAAPGMGKVIAEEGMVPDLVLCSTARRARRTWELAAGALAGAGAAAPEPQPARELYLATPDAMVALVRARAGPARRVMLVGHNPGLHELALRLVREGAPKARARLAEKFPTAALARLRVEGDGWEGLGQAGATLLGFWRPRDGGS